MLLSYSLAASLGHWMRLKRGATEVAARRVDTAPCTRLGRAPLASHSQSSSGATYVEKKIWRDVKPQKLLPFGGFKILLFVKM